MYIKNYVFICLLLLVRLIFYLLVFKYKILYIFTTNIIDNVQNNLSSVFDYPINMGCLLRDTDILLI